MNRNCPEEDFIAAFRLLAVSADDKQALFRRMFEQCLGQPVPAMDGVSGDKAGGRGWNAASSPDNATTLTADQPVAHRGAQLADPATCGLLGDKGGQTAIRMPPPGIELSSARNPTSSPAGVRDEADFTLNGAGYCADADAGFGATQILQRDIVEGNTSLSSLSAQFASSADHVGRPLSGNVTPLMTCNFPRGVAMADVRCDLLQGPSLSPFLEGPPKHEGLPQDHHTYPPFVGDTQLVDLGPSSVPHLERKKESRFQGEWLVKLPLPTYSGYNDSQTADGFIADFMRFGRAQGMRPFQLLHTVLPVALVGDANLWWKFRGEFCSWEDFVRAFQAEFNAPDYVDRLQRELNDRTQHPDEPLGRFIRVIASFYERLGLDVSEATMIRRICTQMHPTFRVLTHGQTFTSLQQLTAAAPALQAEAWSRVNYKLPPKPMGAVAPDLAFWRSQSTPDGQRYSAPSPQGDQGKGKAPTSSALSGTSSVSASQPVPEVGRELPPRRQYRASCWSCGSPDHFRKDCPASSSGNAPAQSADHQH
jgi:hypothetical protein